VRTALRSAFLAILAVLVAGPASARSLKDTLGGASETVGITGGSAFDALAENIADTAARSLPVVAASAGFTYRYNPELEVFERSTDTLGPLFLERPQTLGRGKFNVNVSFQYVQFDQFDGDDLTSLQNSDPIVLNVLDAGGNVIAQRANRLVYSLGIQNYVTAFSFTYGILDDLDVNLLVPVIATTLKVGVRSQQVEFAEPGQPFAPDTGPLRVGRTGGSKTGVGDLLLRFKYQLARLDWLRSAAALQLRMPSGDQDNFQGTGSFEASPFFFASTILWDRVEPHANVGIDLRADDVARSQARWGIGVDADLHPRVGLSLDFLGRNEFEGSADADETSFLHLTSAGVRPRPLLGLDFDRKDYYDVSFGVRGVIFGNVMLFANVIRSLNDDGLRNDSVIPAFGVEGTF
jgi:outer membrane putative beta-barrel porin/alpha-amylase